MASTPNDVDRNTVIPPDNPDPVEAELVDGDSSVADELLQADELIPDEQPDPIEVNPSDHSESGP